MTRAHGGEGKSAASTASLLRGIADTARAHGDVWDVARLAEMLELYGSYLRERTDDGRTETATIGFAEFVADEALIERVARRRPGGRKGRRGTG